MPVRSALPGVIAAVLAVQLTTAAGALAGPWALPAAEPAGQPAAAPALPGAAAGPPAPATAAAPTASVGAAPAAAHGPLTLSAPDLWAGAVPLAPLGVEDTGALAVPATESELGWWSDGPRPGAVGAAVVVGHVDLDGRAGVLSRLAEAQLGASVVVTHADGQLRYRVTSVDQYAKDAFPTDAVYRPTSRTTLRLITCGGRFDPRTGHYEDNVVLTAERV